MLLFFFYFSLVDALGSFQQLQICESLPPCAWAYTHHQLAQRLHTTSVSCISRHENVHVRKGRLIATDAQLFISLCVGPSDLKKFRSLQGFSLVNSVVSIISLSKYVSFIASCWRWRRARSKNPGQCFLAEFKTVGNLTPLTPLFIAALGGIGEAQHHNRWNQSLGNRTWCKSRFDSNFVTRFWPWHICISDVGSKCWISYLAE